MISSDLADSASVHPARLLVIDDDASVRTSIRGFLEDSGFTVLEADSGKRGVSICAEQQPDLVLCDLRLPDLDGLEVIRSVASTGINIPVIVISGLGEVHDVVQALRLGAADYLTKPIKDLEVLEHSIRRSLNQAELIAQNKSYAEQLENTNFQLRHSLDLLRLDQQAGRSVQTQLLPETPFHTEHFCCQHRIVPSLYLSGDSTDYWEAEDGSLVFYVADVSGHGASSAFVTVLLKYVGRNTARQQSQQYSKLSAKWLLNAMNRELYQANLQKHATAFLGILDPEGRELEYAAAGHYPMPILSLGGEHSFLQGSSLPLGVRAETDYECNRIQISDDFKMILFSDGVLELMDHDSLEEKEVALLELVAGSDGDFESLKARLNLENISDAPDDIALLTVHRRAP